MQTLPLLESGCANIQEEIALEGQTPVSGTPNSTNHFRPGTI